MSWQKSEEVPLLLDNLEALCRLLWTLPVCPKRTALLMPPCTGLRPVSLGWLVSETEP